MTQAYFGTTEYTPSLPQTITGFSAAPGHVEAAYLTTASKQSGGPTFRVRAEKLSNGDILIVAEPVNDIVATLHALELVEIIVSACALVIAAVLGWWLVRRGLRPLVAMERTAESISEGVLDERVPGANETTEVGRLARTLNVMLTRIQQAFAQRDATEAELRASEERLRRFVADASHELRTPLAAVSAYAELFERGASDRPEDLGRVLHGIRAETGRMGRLVEDLLLLARLDEGIPMATAEVELVSIAADAIGTGEAVGPAWPVNLVAANPVEIKGDAARLRQVVDNLLANVRSHTPPGTTTTVTVATDQTSAIIEVADNGPGLTEEQASKVFERFYRTDHSRSRARGGAGLGLSIAASIVAAHRGTIRAAPGSSGGAVFTVRIPLT
jgi:two-component system OmpR family sensor kinase